ncbi:hypothetical protein MNBD_GAMMA11-1891 [hydrothermal vent metagenome]|uniref:HTH marR-type domain-containing protein n=1 Tax=hydrothermal vent metagenome TaxID=652676 RepID=A0A3B0XBM9_9ZZZZ
MLDIKNNKRVDDLNQALEAIHFGFRALTARPDERLAEIAYSRVHHRVLYFVARNSGCSINELLGVMGVSKQYLHRPLKQLAEDGYVEIVIDSDDRRVKRINLTRQGAGLEFELSDGQRARFENVFQQAGPQAEAGWRKVMQLLAVELKTES